MFGIMSGSLYLYYMTNTNPNPNKMNSFNFTFNHIVNGYTVVEVNIEPVKNKKWSRYDVSEYRNGKLETSREFNTEAHAKRYFEEITEFYNRVFAAAKELANK